LKQGDLNTKYFHSVVNWRRVKNSFNGLFVNSAWCEDKEVFKDQIRDFFMTKFDRIEGPQVRLDNVQFNSIFGANNDTLVGSFSEEEIKNAVWSCDNPKSPGSDGFNFEFIKFSWDVIKKDIILAVNDFAKYGK